MDNNCWSSFVVVYRRRASAGGLVIGHVIPPASLPPADDERCMPGRRRWIFAISNCGSVMPRWMTSAVTSASHVTWLTWEVPARTPATRTSRRPSRPCSVANTDIRAITVGTCWGTEAAVPTSATAGEARRRRRRWQSYQDDARRTRPPPSDSTEVYEAHRHHEVPETAHDARCHRRQLTSNHSHWRHTMTCVMTSNHQQCRKRRRRRRLRRQAAWPSTRSLPWFAKATSTNFVSFFVTRSSTSTLATRYAASRIERRFGFQAYTMRQFIDLNCKLHVYIK